MILKWTTTEEVNSSAFEIERSSNGLEFQKIGLKNAQGNSTTPHNYQYIDQDLLSGTYFYRLKMVDLDATYEYSEIVSIRIESLITQLRAFPNPVVDELEIVFHSNLAGTIDYHIYNLNGKKVKTARFLARKGGNQTTLSVADLEPGIYILYQQGHIHAKPLKFFKSR